MNPDPAPQPGPTNDISPGRTRSGDLYRAVAAHLAAHPDTVHKVSEITAAIGARSAGAVFEALKRMTAAGHATHTTGPHRFQITQAGVDAAGALPPPITRPAGDRPARGRPAPVARPNGTLYYPRRLAAGTDIDILRGLRAAGVPVLLYGPPGTGKTSLVEAAFNDAVTIAGHGDTTVEDFTGSYIPRPDGGFDYQYGLLVTAMTDGRPLFIDDATLIPPRVLAVLYPAMDGRGQIALTGHRSETITAAPGFYVIAGHNPGVHGAILTDALASRFAVHIHVTSDWDLARRLHVPGKAIQAAIALNRRYDDGDTGWAPQLRELLTFATITKTLGIKAAAANLAAIAPDADRPDVLTELRHHFGPDLTPLRLGPQR
jgi:hypothetical protein